jgi:hypothetical protein
LKRNGNHQILLDLSRVCHGQKRPAVKPFTAERVELHEHAIAAAILGQLD